MKVEEIRNIALVGHGGVGKTILADAMLCSAGITNRVGTIEDGNTISDFHPQEIERQISITTSLMHLNWQKRKLNLIDVPGFLDFLGELHGAMHVADNAAIVLDAGSGIEVGTESAWNRCQLRNLTKFFILNKMDKEDIQFDKVTGELKAAFGDSVVVAQVPVKTGPGFEAIVDFVLNKMLVFKPEGDGKYTEEAIPADLQDKIEEMRMAFVESVVENDEKLMDKYLGDEEITAEELDSVLANACRTGALQLVLCCSARTNVGVSRILDVIATYGASPEHAAPAKGKDDNGEAVERACDPDAPVAAFVFKTVSLPHVGELAFTKVLSGHLKVGMDTINTTTKSSERISSLFLLNGKDRKDTAELTCGDIGAIIKLKATKTNDTLSASNAIFMADPIQFPPPLIFSALAAKNKGDEDKVGMGLSAIQKEDPTFLSKFDPELRQTVVSGQGELQLDIMVQRLKERYHVEVELTKPRIPYRVTITKTVDFRKKYKKQTGGRGQYGDVHIEIKPLARGAGFEFIDNIVGGVIPGKYIPAVEKGVVGAMTEGMLVGAKVVDLSCRLFDGSYHNVDSSDLAFQVAGAQAFKNCMEKADPIVLEPIHKIEVRVPEEFMGAIMGDVSSRRGRVLGMEADGPFQVIRAEVPLAELYRYSSSLRSMTQGRGTYSREFVRYEPVPRDVQAKLIEAYEAEKEAEG